MVELIYLGVDASWTATALCALSFPPSGVETRNETLICTDSKSWSHAYARLHHIGEKFMHFVENTQPTHIAIEGYSFGSKQGREGAGELGGHLRWMLHKAGYSFLIVPPLTLKKFVTGKGQGKKEQMMLHAYKRWSYEGADNNACDAYCLSRLWWQISTKPELKLTQELLKKCEAVHCA